MTAQPSALPHVQRWLEVGVLAEGQHADEQVDLGGLVGDRVDESLAERRSGPTHLAVLAGLVSEALREAVGDCPAAVVAAELRVAHGHLAGSAAPLPGLVVEQPQVDVHFGHLLDVLPADVPLGCDVEDLAADSIDIWCVLVVILLDSPRSRSSIIGFALVFLVICVLLPYNRLHGVTIARTVSGDTRSRSGRYGLSEIANMAADTETAKRALSCLWPQQVSCADFGNQRRAQNFRLSGDLSLNPFTDGMSIGYD